MKGSLAMLIIALTGNMPSVSEMTIASVIPAEPVGVAFWGAALLALSATLRSRTRTRDTAHITSRDASAVLDRNIAIGSSLPRPA